MYKKKLIASSLGNLASSIIPALISLPLIGYMSRVLNASEFNMVLLIFGFLNFLQFLDFGYSKAIANIVAKEERGIVIGYSMGNALLFTTAIGMSFALIILVLSGYFVKYLNLIEVIGAREAIVFSALSVPLYLSVSVIQGYYEGAIKIIELNKIKIYTNISFLLFPCGILFFNKSVLSVALGFFLARFFALMYCWFSIKKSGLILKINLKSSGEMKKFGIWLTVTNIVSPLMSISDKYYLTTIYPSALVASYSIASETVMRLLVFPGSIGRALFPILSKDRSGKSELKLPYIAMILFGILIIFPMYLLADEIFKLWLGTVQDATSEYFKILLVGLFFVSLSQIPYGYIQAKYGTKPTAIIHLVELPLYILCLYFFTKNMGLIGAAYSWTLRLVLDYILLETYLWSKGLD